MATLPVDEVDEILGRNEAGGDEPNPNDWLGPMPSYMASDLARREVSPSPRRPLGPVGSPPTAPPAPRAPRAARYTSMPVTDVVRDLTNTLEQIQVTHRGEWRDASRSTQSGRVFTFVGLTESLVDDAPVVGMLVPEDKLHEYGVANAIPVAIDTTPHVENVSAEVQAHLIEVIDRLQRMGVGPPIEYAAFFG